MRNILMAAAVGNVVHPGPMLDFDYWDDVLVQPIVVMDAPHIYDAKQSAIAVTNQPSKVEGRYGDLAIGCANSKLLAYSGDPFSLYGDFTFELSIRFDDVTSSSNQYIFDYGNNGLILRFYGESLKIMQAGGTLVDSGVKPIAGKWYHIAIVRDNYVLKFFLDGVLVGQTPNTQNFSYSQFALGNYGGGGSYAVLGVIDQFRLTARAVYRENFTPPIGALPVGRQEANYDPEYDKVSALIKSTGAGTVADKREFNNVTPLGGALMSTAQKRFGQSSMHFPSQGARFTLDGDPSLYNFGAGDFTVECHVRLEQTQSGAVVLVGRKGNGVNAGWALMVTNQRLGFYISSAQGSTWNVSLVVPLSNALRVGQWIHVAATRQNNELRLYMNGQRVTSVVTAVAVAASTVPVSIGGGFDGAAETFLGQIDEVRITKGVSRYCGPMAAIKRRSGFAESSGEASPMGDVYQGRVMAGFEFERDLSNGYHQFINSLNRAGSVLDSSRPLFGDATLTIPTGANGGLAYTNGSKALLVSPDFTIESWINTDYSGETPTLPIISQWHASSGGAWMFGIRSKKLVFWYTATLAVYSDIDIDDGQWHHVAVVRHEGLITLFVDGVSVGSVNYTGALTYNGPVQIGYNIQGVLPSGYRLNLSRLKVTSGKARYGRSFTPNADTVKMVSMAS